MYKKSFLLFLSLILSCFCASLAFADIALPETAAAVNAQPLSIKKIDRHLSLLFVQTAKKGVLTPIKGQYNTYQFVLHDVSKLTYYFSDRPKRIAGAFSTKAFIKHWSTGAKDSFEKNPPNTTLESLKNSEYSYRPLGKIVILMHPKYHAEKHTLTYTVKVLSGAAPLHKTIKLKDVSLFIDNSCPGCYGIAF